MYPDKNSITDTLKSRNLDSSYENRAKLYGQSGLGTEKDYLAKGGNNANENTALNKLFQDPNFSYASSFGGKRRYDALGNLVNEQSGVPVNKQINMADPNMAGVNPSNGNNTGYANQGGTTPPAPAPAPATVTPTKTDGKSVYDPAKEYYDNLIRSNDVQIEKLRNDKLTLNDPELQNKIEEINLNYNYLKGVQERNNAVQQSSGRQFRFSQGNGNGLGVGASSSGMAQLVNDGLGKLTEIEGKRLSAVNSAIAAYKQGNTKETERLIENSIKYRKEYRLELNTLDDNLRADKQLALSEQRYLATEYKDARKEVLEQFKALTFNDRILLEYKDNDEKKRKKQIEDLAKQYGLPEEDIKLGFDLAEKNAGEVQRKEGTDARAEEQLELSRKSGERAEASSLRAEKQLALSERRAEREEKKIPPLGKQEALENFNYIKTLPEGRDKFEKIIKFTDEIIATADNANVAPLLYVVYNSLSDVREPKVKGQKRAEYSNKKTYQQKYYNYLKLPQ